MIFAFTKTRKKQKQHSMLLLQGAVRGIKPPAGRAAGQPPSQELELWAVSVSICTSF